MQLYYTMKPISRVIVKIIKLCLLRHIKRNWPKIIKSSLFVEWETWALLQVLDLLKIQLLVEQFLILHPSLKSIWTSNVHREQDMLSLVNFCFHLMFHSHQQKHLMQVSMQLSKVQRNMISKLWQLTIRLLYLMKRQQVGLSFTTVQTVMVNHLVRFQFICFQTQSLYGAILQNVKS